MELSALPQPSFVRCRGCHRPIDVWEPPGLSIDPDPATGRFVLTRVDPSEALCPECRVQATPEARRADLATLSRAQRTIRAQIDAPPLGTIFVMHARGDRTVRWATEFLVTVYGFKLPEWNPTFPQPRLCFTPDDPTERPLNFVWFAAEVVNDATPQAWLTFQWSYADPERPGRMELKGWDAPALTEDDLDRIVRGVRFFREAAAAMAKGRPQGTFKRDRRWYLDAYRNLARTLGQSPTQAEFCEAYDVDRSTMRRNLKPSGSWPWKRFVAAASRAQSVRR